MIGVIQTFQNDNFTTSEDNSDYVKIVEQKPPVKKRTEYDDLFKSIPNLVDEDPALVKPETPPQRKGQSPKRFVIIPELSISRTNENEKQITPVEEFALDPNFDYENVQLTPNKYPFLEQ